MENKEQELLAEIKKQTGEAITEKLAGYASAEELSGLKSLIEGKENKEEVEAIKSVVNAIEVTLKAMKEQPKTAKQSKLRAMVQEHGDAIKSIKKDGGRFHQMQMKAFDTATIGGVWTDFLEPQFVDGIVRTPDTQAEFNILNYVTVGQAFSEIVKWIEEDTETGTALFIDECIAKPDVSKDWKRGEAAVVKVADYTRICDEVLLYLDWAEQEIRLFLRKLVYKALQDGIINGDGVGQNLLGITPQASAFVAGALAASVPDANEVNAINAAVSNINCLGYRANYVMMHCTDIFKLNNSIKDSTGQPIAGAPVVPVIDCPFIPAGSFLVGDFSRSNVRFLQDITVEMGMNGEDFRENAVSMRGEAFLTHYIASNDANAFIYDTFANVITAIDIP